jgi:phosphocarrier protein
MPTVTRDITIVNALGLHARPAMQFVDLANSFASQVTVRKGGPDPYEVDGKSVMQMITLEAVQGTPLTLFAEGDDAQAAVDALAKLVAERFGEDE